MKIEVYADGSGTVKDAPGGYGFVVCVEGVKVAEGSGYIAKATNNVAEITAAISGLEYVATHDLPGVETGNKGCGAVEVVLVSDSQLTLRYATGEYQCKKPHLLPLYLKLRKQFNALGATTRWVKGHAGDEHNERCDKLASAARQSGSSQGNSILDPPFR